MKSPFISLIRTVQRKSVSSQMAGQSLPRGVQSFLDRRYASDKNPRHILDIHYPEDTSGLLPVIISIHGGAFVAGEKWYNTEHSMKLCKQGFVLVNAEYTPLPNTDLFGIIHDMFLIAKWVKENIKNYHGNPNKISAIGDSAGSWILLTYSLLNHSEELRSIYKIDEPSYDFKSLGLICPVANIEKAMKYPCHIFWFKHYVYKFGSKRRKRYNLTSIQDTLNKGKLPPCYILTSKGDSYYYQFSVELSQLFANNKIEHKYKKYIPSNRILEHCFNIMHPDYPESIDANQDLLRFILSHI